MDEKRDENREWVAVSGPKVDALKSGLETRDEFADRSGISRRTLSKIVNAATFRVQVKTLDALARSRHLVRPDGSPDREAIYQQIGVDGGPISLWWARMLGNFVAQPIDVRNGTAQALSILPTLNRRALIQALQAVIDAADRSEPRSLKERDESGRRRRTRPRKGKRGRTNRNDRDGAAAG